ncbi:MAG: Spy/CpxP family protein refolding chaperone [Acidobacteria bacterium]|nr:Spy/CpxP family protein refolding chaperone [Acidobacteriota bacterium]
MRTTRRRGGPWVVLAALALLAPQAEDAEGSQRHKWWQSDAVKAELDLTDGQSAELEEIFQAMRPRQKELVERLRVEEEALAAIMQAPDAAEWEVTLQIDRVETTRSALSKTRTLMLYRMHRVLAPPQRDALHDLWERRRRSRTRC